jgi:hypothetical protein
MWHITAITQRTIAEHRHTENTLRIANAAQMFYTSTYSLYQEFEAANSSDDWFVRDRSLGLLRTNHARMSTLFDQAIEDDIATSSRSDMRHA